MQRLKDEEIAKLKQTILSLEHQCQQLTVNASTLERQLMEQDIIKNNEIRELNNVILALRGQVDQLIVSEKELRLQMTRYQ